MSAQPDAILIGNQKAGTTYLRSYFTHHPQISWTRNASSYLVEESGAPRASFHDTHGGCTVDVFETLARGCIFREASEKRPDTRLTPQAPMDGRYLQADHNEVAARIAEVLPDTRILMIVRNQVDWLRSNYLHYLNHLPADRRRFRDFLTTLEGKSLLYSGFYDQTISAYRSSFGREHVHVVILEELEQHEEQVLRRLCGFLGVNHVPFGEGQRSRNAGRGIVAANKSLLRSRLGLEGRTLKLARLVGRPGRALLGRVFARDVLSEGERSILESVYATSNHIASRLLNTNLASFGYPV